MTRLPWMILTVLLLLARTGSAYDRVVDKKTFSLPAYTTVNGPTIKNVRVGWESYGTLNPAKDNVVLVTHFYSGTSHAPAGTRRPIPPPVLDAIIGSARPSTPTDSSS